MIKIDFHKPKPIAVDLNQALKGWGFSGTFLCALTLGIYPIYASYATIKDFIDPHLLLCTFPTSRVPSLQKTTQPHNKYIHNQRKISKTMQKWAYTQF